MACDMHGTIDIHVHSGPSVASRKLDAGDMLKDAEARGYRAFVAKDHYFPTMMGTDMITKFLGDGSCEAFGCIVLNNSVGGINLYAVDAACAMGAKIVFMPTVSARNHIEHHKGKKFVGAGKMKIEEKPIYYLDEKGELLPEVEELLRFLASYYPDVTLGTGHGSVEETDKLVERAAELGIRKILVNHPFFEIDGTIEDCVRWAKKGAFIELNALVYDDVEPAPHHLSFDIVRQIYEQVGYRNIVIDSDLGQTKYMLPVDGLQKFADLIMDRCGATQEQMRVMLVDNPAWLMGLAER